MKKKLFTMLLALCLILTAVVPAFATEQTTFPEELTIAPDQCGDALTWTYEEGVLTITGEGPMYDYLEGGPWSEYKEALREVIFTGGVTYVGAYAFKDYDALETVDFGDAMYEIGMEAFRSCDSLTVIHLPESFKIFGESSFENCENLTEIHSQGRFPSFRQNALWNTWASIYFPVEKPWDVELIRELEEAFHGRIEFLASDGSDPYEPTEATTVPTETEAPTTEAATEPTTEPATVPTTEPAETVQTAAPETEAPETTQMPTEQIQQTQPEEKDGPGGVVIGGSIVVVILVLAVLGTLIFGKGRRGGKYSR